MKPSIKPYSPAYRKRVRELNDALRQDILDAGAEGRVMLTRGVTILEATDQIRLIRLVNEFSEFNPDNDPHGEHDFGKITMNAIDYFWKIDYYDWGLQFHSRDPSDEVMTARVLTIMRADEY